jgi:hypothetical protein
MNVKLSPSYFEKQTLEEDVPCTVDSQVQLKYQQLDELYEKFFSESSLSYAKVNLQINTQQSSKEERDKKGLNDSSFVYGEIVYNKPLP